MGILSNIFGGGSNERVHALIVAGAVIIDVRSQEEFRGGHNKGAKNIPLQDIESQIKKIKAFDKPVVVCCASGMRSGQAKGILKRAGIEVENAGSWRALEN